MRIVDAGPRLALLLTSLACLMTSPIPLEAQTPTPPESGWQVFEMDELRELRAESGQAWHQFLQVPDLFAGVYEIEAGGTDSQTPHAADEVYYVVAGQATIVVADERAAVRPGTIVYVAKDLEHRFEDVVEDLTVLVFFATPGGG